MKLFLFFLFLSFFGLEPEGNPRMESRAILYIFEGSDWCSNCARLEKKILTDEGFLHEVHMLNIKLERIDFPQRTRLSPEIKKYNESIAEKFGFDGIFPTLIIARMDTDQYLPIEYHNESVDEILLLIRQKLEQLYE
jgi:hypothetical protein